MRKWSMARFALLFVFGLASLGIIAPVTAAADRVVTARAACDGHGGANAIPDMIAQVTNQSGKRLYVIYVVGFSTSEAIGTRGLDGLQQAETPEQQIVTIEQGESATLVAPWAGREPRDHEVFVALILTSAGMLLPACGPNESRLTIDGPLPVVAGEEGRESATAMAKMIGSLESLKAYPALFALLHPDSRALTSFGAVACSYAAIYGPPVTKTTRTIYSTNVKDVTFVDWSWPVSGETYDSAAEVSYTQTTGVFPHQDEPTAGVEHLVRVDGIWRWFFGTDEVSLQNAPAECGLPAFN